MEIGEGGEAKHVLLHINPDSVNSLLPELIL
jgi:hypothetical protein